VAHRGLMGGERPLQQAAGGLAVGDQNQVRRRRRAPVHPSSGRDERDVVHDVVAAPSDPLLHHEGLGRAQPSERRRVSRRAVELSDPRIGEELGHASGSVPTVTEPNRGTGRARGKHGDGAYDLVMASTAPARRHISVPPSLAEVGARAEARIVALLDDEVRRWSAVDPDLAEPIGALRDLVLAGGKRLRPAFCHWAYVGAGGPPEAPLVVDAGAALELLHTFALVHDDVMDGSDLRRGMPAIHRGFINRHDAAAWRGEARRFGEGAAILVGDFAFVYADMLFADVPPPARRIFDELRVELCVGQYLDLVGTASASSDPAQADRIERYKSGKYTVERPLHLGAALAGRLEELQEPLSAVGLPLGEAFQLRDDLLGVFGDTATTGKPVGDDLREGKLTPLVAVAAARADAPGAALLQRLGHADLSDGEVAALQAFLVDCGARDVIEQAIEGLVERSLAALDAAPLTPEARGALQELGTYVAWRDR
jgi:geranylgeranyl diphosphate synthase, type I